MLGKAGSTCDFLGMMDDPKQYRERDQRGGGGGGGGGRGEKKKGRIRKERHMEISRPGLLRHAIWLEIKPGQRLHHFLQELAKTARISYQKKKKKGDIPKSFYSQSAISTPCLFPLNQARWSMNSSAGQKHLLLLPLSWIPCSWTNTTSCTEPSRPHKTEQRGLPWDSLFWF